MEGGAPPQHCRGFCKASLDRPLDANIFPGSVVTIYFLLRYHADQLYLSTRNLTDTTVLQKLLTDGSSKIRFRKWGSGIKIK